MDLNRKIIVYASWLDEDTKVGTLYGTKQRGVEKYSFEYCDEWLNQYNNLFLDPDLFNGIGRQFCPQDKKIFGIFSDCAPDRWGRSLLERKEKLLAKTENRSRKILNELDYVLGVTDVSRIGGLRFKYEGQDNYVAEDELLSVPPFEDLPKLETASLEYEKNENTESYKWLKLLLSPGSSLGGARPKVTVRDIDGSLWVAKFPSRRDEYNTGAWEYTVNKLAALCGLNTTESKMFNFSDKGSTFLSKRFDRVYPKNKNEIVRRIHYASSMTVLGKTDGANYTDGTSYLDIAEFIKSNSSQPEKDLEELWNRIYFNVTISNTDDHLRNHGFLLTKDGWKLSPLFDINPNPMGLQLSLGINNFGDNELDLSVVLENAIFYGLSYKKAKENGDKISQIVNDNWKRIALSCGINKSEINFMEDAFQKK